MALRRRRDGGEDSFAGAHHDLDWNTLVQVEPDVGVTADDQWSHEHPVVGYSSHGASVDFYDVEQEEAPIASSAAVDAWFNSDGVQAIATAAPSPDVDAYIDPGLAPPTPYPYPESSIELHHPAPVPVADPEPPVLQDVLPPPTGAPLHLAQPPGGDQVSAVLDAPPAPVGPPVDMTPPPDPNFVASAPMPAPVPVPDATPPRPVAADPEVSRPSERDESQNAFSKRTGRTAAIKRAPKRPKPVQKEPAPAPDNAETPKDDQQRVIVIELSDKPLRFATPFNVAEPKHAYEDDFEIIEGLIYIDEPEPFLPLEVRMPPGGIRRRQRTIVREERPPSHDEESSPPGEAASGGFSFVSLIGADGAPVKRRPEKAPDKTTKKSTKKPQARRSSAPKQRSQRPRADKGRPGNRPAADKQKTNTAARRSRRSSRSNGPAGDERSENPSTVESRRGDKRRDDNKRPKKPVSHQRIRAPKLLVREVNDQVELLLLDHKDVQLRHFGPITVESTLWPPGMRVDSISEHMNLRRWPRDEGLEVWVRLPQICEELWRELSITDIVSRSTVETWIAVTDVEETILHQMRLSFLIDETASPRNLLRSYRQQAEQFVGYGLDALVNGNDEAPT